jgi:hypothetical protein
MNLRGKRRWIVSVACGLLIVCALPFCWHYWYFREVEHQRVASPDGQSEVVVTKQMNRFLGDAQVRLKIFQNSKSEVAQLVVVIDWIDVWSDAKPDSYRVEWISATEFRIGGEHPDDGFETRWSFDGQQWTGRPDGWVTLDEVAKP